MFTLTYLANVVTLEFDSSKCNGCKMCLIVCPHEVFDYIDKRAVVARIDNCMECGACALNCEPGALSVRSGVGCAAGIISGMLKGTAPTCGCGPDDSDGCCC